MPKKVAEKEAEGPKCPKCERTRTRVYAPCWKCHREMGCHACAGIVRDLLCEDGRKFHQEKLMHGGIGPVWTSVNALCEHGVMKQFGQTIEDYPSPWQEAYRRSA